MSQQKKNCFVLLVHSSAWMIYSRWNCSWGESQVTDFSVCPSFCHCVLINDNLRCCQFTHCTILSGIIGGKNLNRLRPKHICAFEIFEMYALNIFKWSVTNLYINVPTSKLYSSACNNELECQEGNQCLDFDVFVY